MALNFTLDEKEKGFLGRIAQEAIESQLAGKPEKGPQAPAESGSILKKSLGSFVTLTERGNLRGCIGTITGREPLYENVWHMARAAAFNDPRFPPLQPGEWPDIKMEITVLGELSPCPDPRQIVIGRDGLVLSWHGRSGVFLPQVPVEQGWDLDEYLTHLCIKAGVPIGAWTSPDAQLFWYQGLVFKVR